MSNFISAAVQNLKRPRILTDEKIRRLAFIFVLFLFIFECYVVQVDYSGPFAYLFDSESLFFFILTVLSLLVSFWLFFQFVVFTLSAAWYYRVICFLIFSFSVFAEYAYQKALGRFSQKFDLELAIATTADQRIDSVAMYMSFAAIVPSIVLFMMLLYLRNEKVRGTRAFIFSNLLLIGGFAIFAALSAQQIPTISTNAFYRTNVEFLIYGPVTSGKWASELTGIKIRRRPIPQPALTDNFRPDNNVIIVVDESVRGDHLSINGYRRETTPFLEKLSAEKRLHNWGIAASASTGSQFTYCTLITGLAPDDFPDGAEFKINTFPTIFQYAKAMNYTTHFFDGQMNGFWGEIGDDRTFLDNWQGVREVSDGLGYNQWDLDNLIAKKVNKVISSSKGNFIFIFKHGSHIPYQINFPPDQETWKPSYAAGSKFDIPSGVELAEAVNAYDNSLRYNVDSFFKNLVDDYSNIPNNSVIIYTADHGQTLFANGRAAHGGNTKEEATVPLFIVGRLSSEVDTGYKASHFNLYPTILDLIDYPMELRERKSIPSLLKAKSADSRPRFFNAAYGTKIPFD